MKITTAGDICKQTDEERLREIARDILFPYKTRITDMAAQASLGDRITSALAAAERRGMERACKLKCRNCNAGHLDRLRGRHDKPNTLARETLPPPPLAGKEEE